MLSNATSCPNRPKEGTNKRAPRRVRALRAHHGFTLCEVLVTVLLMGLRTMAVAAGIGVSAKSYGSIMHATNANALMGNAVTTVHDDMRIAYYVEAFIVASSSDSSVYAVYREMLGYGLLLVNYTKTMTVNGPECCPP